MNYSAKTYIFIHPKSHLLRVRDINWTNERPQLIAAALSAVAFVLSVFGSFHCSFATSNTYLFGIFGYGVRGDECIAFDKGDELYDVDQFWSIAKVASILAVALGLFAMNFIWCTIVYGYGRNLIVAILLMAALCQCFSFLFFESSLCKKHFFACYYGPGSYCCAAAVVLWIYIAVTISCCNDLKHANNNYLT